MGDEADRIGEHRVSTLELQFREWKTTVTVMADDIKSIKSFIEESRKPKQFNWPALVASGFTMVAIIGSILTMWIKPLEMKLEVANEKLSHMEKSRKDDYTTLKEGLVERIAYSFDRLKTEMKLQGQLKAP